MATFCARVCCIADDEHENNGNKLNLLINSQSQQLPLPLLVRSVACRPTMSITSAETLSARGSCRIITQHLPLQQICTSFLPFAEHTPCPPSRFCLLFFSIPNVSFYFKCYANSQASASATARATETATATAQNRSLLSTDFVLYSFVDPLLAEAKAKAIPIHSDYSQSKSVSVPMCVCVCVSICV